MRCKGKSHSLPEKQKREVRKKHNESALVWISLKAEPEDLNPNSYVEAGCREQGRGSRENEMGQEDKPVKGVVLSIFQASSTGSQSCWGICEEHQNCPSKRREAWAFIQ